MWITRPETVTYLGTNRRNRP